MEANRKTHFLRTLFLLFLGIMLAVNGPISVSAAQADSYSLPMKKSIYLQSKVVYLPYKDVDKVIKNHGYKGFKFEEIAPKVSYSFKIRNGNHIVASTVRSSDEDVIKVDESSVHETSEAVNGDTGSHSASVSGYVYYPGTADISFQDEYGRTYVVNVVVLPYENPLKSLDVTNVKWWSLSGKVDKFNAYLPKNGLSFRKNTAKPTVKLKAADGWKIMDVTVKCKSRSKGSKNQSVTLNEVKKKSKTVKLKKVSKGDLIQVTVTLQNSATQAEQTVRLGSFH